MQIKEKRKIAADWLQQTLDGVRGIISQPGKGFNFKTYVHKWDKDNRCGTVCCMEGWLPSLYPKQTKWVEDQYTNGDFFHKVVSIPNGVCFFPKDLGIPINASLWKCLTVPHTQHLLRVNIRVNEDLERNASFEEVSEWWAYVIDAIRKGDLDDYLSFN